MLLTLVDETRSASGSRNDMLPGPVPGIFVKDPVL